MELEKAYIVIGMRPGEGGAPEVQAVYEARAQEALRQLNLSPNDTLRRVYQERLAELLQARDVLLACFKDDFGGLTDSQIDDLPGGQPSYSEEPSSRPASMQPGQVLANRYEIRRLIGSGGMGAVYAAWDRIREEEVAVKVLLSSLTSKETARRRFLNEAKIATALSHPGIVRVFDLQNDGSLYFITMERLEGRSLRQEILARKDAGQIFSLNEVTQIARQLCDALSYAHTQTVHRDIKPENIWLTPQQTIKIMDFGLARLVSPSQLTSTSIAMGTAYYMAPEQIQGARDVDERADQYSVGAVLYELITGQVPSGAFREPRHWCKQLPDRLNAAIMQMLQQDPELRFPNMAAITAALEVPKAAKERHPKVRKWIKALFLFLVILATFRLCYSELQKINEEKRALAGRYEETQAHLGKVTSEHQHEKASFQEQLGSLQKERDALRVERDALRSKVTLLENDSGSETTIRNLKAEVAELRESLAEANTEKEHLESQLTALKDKAPAERKNHTVHIKNNFSTSVRVTTMIALYYDSSGDLVMRTTKDGSWVEDRPRWSSGGYDIAADGTCNPIMNDTWDGDACALYMEYTAGDREYRYYTQGEALSSITLGE